MSTVKLGSIKKVTLPSGAELTISLAPFADGKALYQAALAEMKSMNLDLNRHLDANFFKDLICAGFSSKEIDRALQACVNRCLYKGLKITDDIWESEEAREDYIMMLFEVGKANLDPFTKSLYAGSSPLWESFVGKSA